MTWLCFGRLGTPSGVYSRAVGYQGKKWECKFWHTGFAHFSFGFHVHLGCPNIEIHLPFGFIRAGIRSEWRNPPEPTSYVEFCKYLWSSLNREERLEVIKSGQAQEAERRTGATSREFGQGQAVKEGRDGAG